MNKTLILSASLDNLEFFLAHVRNFVTSCGADANLLYPAELSVEEVLVNIISYAYPNTEKGNIEVSCSWECQQGLAIEIVDSGIAFDPLGSPDPDTGLSLDERKIGGLGIFLTRKMMDKVTYERSQGKNRVTMIKQPRG